MVEIGTFISILWLLTVGCISHNLYDKNVSFLSLLFAFLKGGGVTYLKTYQDLNINSMKKDSVFCGCCRGFLEKGTNLFSSVEESPNLYYFF